MGPQGLPRGPLAAKGSRVPWPTLGSHVIHSSWDAKGFPIFSGLSWDDLSFEVRLLAPEPIRLSPDFLQSLEFGF